MPLSVQKLGEKLWLRNPPQLPNCGRD